MLGPMMTFQDGADLEQAKVRDFLCMGKAQAAHTHRIPTPRLRVVSFVDVSIATCMMTATRTDFMAKNQTTLTQKLS